MEVGIIGLPASGKTTLFATLTGQDAQPGFSGKVEVHRGVVQVPDARLDRLTDIFNPRKKVPATIQYIEVGGMDSDSKGFDAQFLQVLKNTAVLCVLIRAFDSETYPHPLGSVDPQRDIAMVDSEFLLSDMAIVEGRIERLEKQVKKAKDEALEKELALMKHCYGFLEQEIPLREAGLSPDEKRILRGYQFLTLKPLVLVINLAEEDIAKEAEILAKIPQRP
ncbi:MAG TPA: 50S ribosome-binding GTPase, partial [Calditrichia bacterium]|nr:50S ribosome-binding GTPase [Calditrichia bacterium]